MKKIKFAETSKNDETSGVKFVGGRSAPISGGSGYPISTKPKGSPRGDAEAELQATKRNKRVQRGLDRDRVQVFLQTTTSPRPAQGG